MMTNHPSIENFKSDDDHYYKDKVGRLWRCIGVASVPTVIMQRADIEVPPVMDMPRLSLVPDSPWAKDWTRATRAEVRAALNAKGRRR